MDKRIIKIYEEWCNKITEKRHHNPIYEEKEAFKTACIMLNKELKLNLDIDLEKPW